jgi:hypothetical protein
MGVMNGIYRFLDREPYKRIRQEEAHLRLTGASTSIWGFVFPEDPKKDLIHGYTILRT